MRALLGAALVAMSGCGGCGASDSGAPPDGSDGQRLTVPEPWTLGVADHALALPPPCEPRAETLRTVLARETRIASEPSTLGRLLVAEGAVVPRFALDASGLMTMRLGRVATRPMPWPAEPAYRAIARSGEHWLILQSRDGGLRVWRDGRDEGTGAGSAEAAVRCGDARCAIVGSPFSPLMGAGATLLVGPPDRDVNGWDRVHVDAVGEAARALGVHAVEGGADGWRATLSLAGPDRVAFVAVEPHRAELLAQIDTRGRLLDVSAGRGAGNARLPALVLRAAERCLEAEGGAVLEREGLEPIPLRSAVTATEGAIHSLEGGAFVSWLAPVRCESSLKVLYASVVRPDGTPIGPVTAVADASEYAVAARGDELDLWLRDGDRLTYARIRCRLPS